MFNDRRLSRDGSTSCASCHELDRAFSDGRPVAVGVFGRQGHRNAPALINRGYGRAFFWDARSSSLEEQVLKPIQDPAVDFYSDGGPSNPNLDPEIHPLHLSVEEKQALGSERGRPREPKRLDEAPQ